MCNIDNKEALIVVAENENAANAVNTTEKEVRYDIYWDRNGKEIYRNQNKEDKDRTFIVKTDKDQATIYSEVRDLNTWADVANISLTLAEQAEGDIPKGTITPHVANIIQIENMDVLIEIYKIALNDDGTANTKAPQNREYGAVIYNDDRVEMVQGDVSNPEANREVSVTYNYYSGDVRTTAHTHPSGQSERYFINGEEYKTKLEFDEKKKTLWSGSTEIKTNDWMQPPSRPDIDNAGEIASYVFARRNKNVYVYIRSGVVAFFKQSIISNYMKNVQKQQLDDVDNKYKEESTKLKKTQQAELENANKEDLNETKKRHKEENQDLKNREKQEKDTLKHRHKEENSPRIYQPPTP